VLHQHLALSLDCNFTPAGETADAAAAATMVADVAIVPLFTNVQYLASCALTFVAGVFLGWSLRPVSCNGVPAAGSESDSFAASPVPPPPSPPLPPSPSSDDDRADVAEPRRRRGASQTRQAAAARTFSAASGKLFSVPPSDSTRTTVLHRLGSCGVSASFCHSCQVC
jgi:hypothetical protein